MKKNILLTIGIFCFTSSGIYAQNDFDNWRKQSNQEFETFKAKSEQEFRDFRAQVNAEFAEFMSQSWEKFQASEGIPIPPSPDPITPPVVEPENKPTTEPLPFGKVIPLPTPTPRPKPISPIQIPTPPETPLPEIVKPEFSFLFYNTECKVTLDNTLLFSLRDASEESTAKAWEILAGNQYDALISDCLNLRNQLNLCDWGYMQLLKNLSDRFLGKESNEAVLLQMFILTQSGYKVRLARTNNRLALLIPFQEPIYEYTFLNINGVKYYVMNKELKGQAFYICNHEFPKEQYFSWQTGQPKLTEKLTIPKIFTSKRHPEIQITVQTNQNLIDFYNNYPLSSRYDLYALAGLSETIKQTLYPALMHIITGKSKTEAAGILLNFLQTAFKYQTDDQQFGYERAFFADENFFYPYNDCEDRSILYSILVKDLLNLETVLLLYPNHLATAVHLPEDIPGDYLTIDNKKFVVCDPTYIGAGIGMAMEDYKQVKVEVIRL